MVESSRPYCRVLLFAALLIFALHKPARASESTIPIMDVDEVEVGMVGYGLTVFNGFELSRFKVTVLGVMRNFLPNQDGVLVKAEHPELSRTGVIAGMSGSPVYFNGKMLGACAYGWSFSTEPIFVITPVKDMLKLRNRRPLFGNEAIKLASRRATRTLTPYADHSRLTASLPSISGDVGYHQKHHSGVAVPISVPLSISGVSARAIPMLAEDFKKYGMIPIQAGGGGADGMVPDIPAEAKRMVPGGSVGVLMVDGDVSMHGIGTITWTDKNHVLGFGHSMYNSGEVYLPATAVEVQHNLASVEKSFKMGVPIARVGALVQDRQAGIMVDTNQRARMIPMHVGLKNGSTVQEINVEVAASNQLTPMLIRSVVASAVSETLSDTREVTFRIETALGLENQRTLNFVDDHFSRGGLLSPALILTRGLGAVSELLNNPFEPVAISRIDLNIEVAFEPQYANIIAISVPYNEVAPGESVDVEIRYRRLAGSEFVRRYSLDIPERIAGSIVTLEVSGGGLVSPDLAPPASLAQMLDYLERRYSARSVVLGLHTPNQGIRLRGEVIDDLPSSMLDTFRSASKTQREAIKDTVIRRSYEMPMIIRGSGQLRLRVKEIGESSP